MASRIIGLAALMVAVASGVVMSRPGLMPPQIDTDNAGATAPALPERRPLKPAPAQPPDLPPASDAIAPATLEVTIRRQTTDGRVRVSRRTVTRTASLVHVASGDGPEWLYERNLVDRRRVSAHLIDHGARVIVFHSDSDLRNELAIAGWAQVLTLGFDSTLLTGATPSTESRTIDGIAFTRFSLTRAGNTLDVWWSAAQLLPAEFTSVDETGRTRLSIQRIRAAVNESVLQRPPSRFPQYRSVDLADWLEEH